MVRGWKLQIEKYVKLEYYKILCQQLFFQGTNPEMNIILKSHVRLTDHGHLLYDANTGRRVDISYIGYAGNPGVDDWKRPKKTFEPCNW